MASTMRSTSWSETTISTFIFGWKMYSPGFGVSPSRKPRWTDPRTSVTLIPTTPSTAIAEATVSKSNGWM